MVCAGAHHSSSGSEPCHEDTQGQRDAWQGCQHLVERATTELALIAHLLGASQDAALAYSPVVWPISERARRSRRLTPSQ